MAFNDLSAAIWSVADLLRGDFLLSEYGKVILPFTILRRLDCCLDMAAGAMPNILSKEGGSETEQTRLSQGGALRFHNRSGLSFSLLLADPTKIRENTHAFIEGFSAEVLEIFHKDNFHVHVERLASARLLYLVVERFGNIDLYPEHVLEADMGLLIEELSRRLVETSAETEGEHFTPRDIIRLMSELLFFEDREVLYRPGRARTLYDPTAGTGGLLWGAAEYLTGMRAAPALRLVGQEVNPEAYAVCKARMLLTGQDADQITIGNTLRNDAFPGLKFDYGLCHPPFGASWRGMQAEILQEHESLGHEGRFGPALPKVSDSQLLFLLHLASKMKMPTEVEDVADGGGRTAIILNGSALFTGDAGSGESEIRKWIIESDLVEAIIALPTDVFYNTGIATYIWVLCNRKSSRRQGKVQLINGVELFYKLRKPRGTKKRELGKEHIQQIVQMYGGCSESEHSTIFQNSDFGFWSITIERPLRLAFQISETRLEDLAENRVFEKRSGLPLLTEALRNISADKTWMSRSSFLADVQSACSTVGLSLSPAQVKAVVNVFGRHDEKAEVCTDRNGNVEPNPDLRETENVPFTDSIHAYFNREVLPKFADAWIDEERTKVGYEFSFTRHYAEIALAKAVEASGLPGVRLRDVATQVAFGRTGTEFDEVDNAVYLPTVGNGKASASLRSLSMKHQNYVQIALDPTKAMANYVAGFYNSHLGLLIRESLKSGTIITHVTKAALRQSSLYLPTIEEQAAVVMVSTRIANASSRLTELEASLWNEPNLVGGVTEELEGTLKEESQDTWLETLPFPLASILWTHAAAGSDPAKRHEILVHFFEAAAAFHALVLLSALRDTEGVATDVKKALRHGIKVASFGTWTNLYSRLSKRVTTMLNSEKDEREKCYELFRATDPNLLKMLCSKGLTRLFEEAGAHRNRTKGHGGFIGDTLATAHEANLLATLADYRKEVGRLWARYPLFMVVPRTGTYRNKRYECDVYRVIGRSAPFKRVPMIFTEIPEEGELYLVEEGLTRPLQVLPLVRIAASPPSVNNAAYFYSRMENDKATMVSYHFENLEVPDLEVGPTEAAVAFINGLLQDSAAEA